MRIAGKGLIDRTDAVQFSFDGRMFQGYRGDTLASALLANGQHLVGRSFKYHRPRGILTAGSEEPNALVTVGRGGRQKGCGVLLSSILKIFFWYDESSLEARFRVATSAKELLRRPMHALPCLTASIAYSIWWIRPAGDHVMQSVSY